MQAFPSEVIKLAKELGLPTLAEEDPHGLLLRALIASKRMGLVLALCPAGGMRPLDAAWLLSGLPTDARLLCVEQSHHALTRLKSSLDTDLRAAFHQQDPDDFLVDIEHHSFDFIYCAADLSAASTKRLQTMLRQGGFLVCFPSQNSELVKMPAEEASLVPLPNLILEESDTPIDKGSLAFYVKADRVLKRRGGRRANADRRSLRRLETES